MAWWEMIRAQIGSLGMRTPYLDKADELIKAAAQEHVKDMRESIEAMRRATEAINKKLGDAYRMD
jgi:hypothetical protein